MIIPVLDLAFGLDPSNPPDDVMEELENDKYYRWVVYMYLPMQFVILFAGFAIIAGTNPRPLGHRPARHHRLGERHARLRPGAARST